MKLYLIALLFGAAAVSSPAAITESDGLVVFEAESYDTLALNGSDHTWGLSNSVAGFSGTGYMEASPNNGLNNGGTTWLTTQPELRYSIHFTTNAPHYVWIRAHASNGSDDSVHAGIDGTTNTAFGITLVTAQYNAWNWTTNRITGVTGRPTLTPSGNGLHTVSLWMREDGMRVDRVLLTTNPNLQPTTGNCFHIPVNVEADLAATMRDPYSAIFSNTPVTVYTGNQFQGGGNPGNQLQVGSTVYYKTSTASTWTNAPLTFLKNGTANANNKYYSATIPGNLFAAGETVQYYFKIPYDDHLPTFIYGTDAQRFNTEIESVAQANPFSYRVLAPPALVTPSPEDWRDHNIYQVFTDRFFDGDPSNNAANPEGNYAPTNGDATHGGDFKGVQQKLDYIKALGATAIWISPVVRNTFGQYHGYHGWDFYSVDPHWGTFEDLTNMIAAAHARGIYVFVDVVANHGGDIINSADSAYPTTFRAPPNGYVMQFRNPAKQYPPPFNTNALNPTIGSLFHTNGLIQDFNSTLQVETGELRNLDDFRTDTAFVRTNMANIYQFWIGQADFDGFRVDTVKHVEMGFWQFWSPQIHQYAAGIGKSNFFMFGETLTGSDPLNGSYTGAQGGGPFKLDSMHDYPLWFTVNSVFAQATGNTKQIEDHFNNIAGNYDPASAFRLATFLDNHDQPRFLSSGNANNNINRLAVALGFMYTARGIPTLYYGTEQAFNGGTRPADREDMFAGSWEFGPSLGDNFNMTHPLFQLIAKLNNFRRAYPSLRRGGHRNLWNTSGGPGLFAYSRTNATEEVFVVFNTAASTQTLPGRPTIYDVGTVLVNLLDTNETLTVVSGKNTPSISVPSATIKMFVAQSLFKPLDPVVVSQSPAHAAGNVSTTAPIVLKFSKPMNTNSVQAAFALTPATAGNFAWNTARDTMTFTAAGLGLPGLTSHVVRILTNAVDAVSTNAFYAPFETFFVTAASTATDAVPPTVSILMPASGSTLAGSYNINGLAADNVAVQRVEFRLDNGGWVVATGTTSWSHTFDTRNFLNGSHIIAARAFDTSGNASTEDSVVVRFFNVPGNYEQRLSAGNANDATNCDASVWIKDQPYTFGSFGYDGGSSNFLGNTIATCAAAQSLYRNERLGAFRYLFDCPAGIYETTLLDAETFWNAPNQRVFDVFINDQQVLTNYDIFAAAGQNTPVTLQFTHAVPDARLEIAFSPTIDNARVSGVAVRKIGDVDSDNNEIPDWWMLGYFNHPTGQDSDFSLADDDPDGDGLTNLQEYLAGFDPLDAASALRITKIERVGNDIEVSWQSALNKTNQLLRSSSPDSGGAWETVGSTTPGTGGIITQPDPGAATNAVQQFYRVRLIQ